MEEFNLAETGLRKFSVRVWVFGRGKEAGMRILVVDDEKLLVKGMKFNLENEGYEVE